MDYAFGDGEAESGAAGVETRGHEGLEDVGQNVRRDPGAVIEHAHGNPTVPLLRLYTDSAAGRNRVKGVP